MQIKRYIAFDLEIAKPIPPDIGDWRIIRPLGITCASTKAEGDVGPLLWYHGQGEKQHDRVLYGCKESEVDFVPPLAGGMTADELGFMLDYIILMVNHGFTLLTWNGLKFDFDVLAEESKRPDEVADLAWNFHTDMMFHFFCIKNYMLGLDTAAKGLGLPGKMEGMHGDLAPLMWIDDPAALIAAGYPELAKLHPEARRQRVLRYVAQDSSTTFQVAKEIEKQGKIEWVSKSGRNQVCYFQDGLLKVCDSIWLPEPDTSWQTDPISRSSFYEWMDYIDED